MKKIRVLVVAGTMNVGGIENQLMHLLRQADKAHFQIDYTTTLSHPFYQDEIEFLGSKCIHISSTEGRRFLKYCIVLYRVLRQGNYDIIHSHELFHSGLVLLTARLSGVKHRFVHAHNWMEGNNPHAKKKLIRRIYNFTMRKLIRWNATEYVACSTLAGKFLYGKGILDKSNYHLVYNSVDTTKFIEKYDQIEEGEFCNDGWLNVIQVGRFTPVKNQLFTVEIAREFKRRRRKIRILVAGNDGGKYEERVKNKIQFYKLEDHMILLGIRKDIDVLMRKSSAFLLPSLYEGMPLVLIEAQASGLSCVTADTYSHEVDFGIGTVKWMRLDQTAAEWADAVEEAIARGRANKTDVIKAIENNGFDSKVFAEKICNLYENAVEGR